MVSPQQSRVLGAQGLYYLGAGLWPLMHMSSFETVTGPKVDDWLVRMVGLLASVIGATLTLAAWRRNRNLEVVSLAAGSAVAFAGVDLWYALRGRISPIYLADAVVEVGFLTMQRNLRLARHGSRK
jgi:energy-converting hydrogenase Eha subunit E